MIGVEAASNPIPNELPASVVDELQWFAVQTRSRHEKKAAAELREKGIQAFLPLFNEKHRWSDRQRVVEVPLFPQYMFVRIAITGEDRISVLRTNGVISLVGTKGVGIPIPDAQIARIQKIIERKIPYNPHLYLNVGKRIRIRGGALDGVEGILTAINGDETLVVSVELIQRSLAVRITGFEIEPVKED
ncbi:MAG: UpxY family transcription antiterminator [Candidatus Acidiferrales bacterium]